MKIPLFLTLALALTLLTAPARAALKVYEGFDFLVGTNLPGDVTSGGALDGWSGKWGSGVSNVFIISAGSLSAPAGYSRTPAGNAARSRNWQRQMYRGIATSGQIIDFSTDGTAYMSFLFSTRNDRWLRVQLSNGSANFTNHGALNNAYFILAVGTITSTSSFTLTSSKVYLYTCKFETKASGDDIVKAKIYSEDETIVGEPAVWDMCVTNTISDKATLMNVYQHEANLSYVDEICIGDTWMDIGGVPEPATAALAALAAGFLLRKVHR